MTWFKPVVGADAQEFEAPSVEQQKTAKLARVVESARLGLTVLALLAAITIVGTAADALAVYNTTHLGHEYLLPLWPTEFNIQPSVALVTCGTIIIIASAVSLVVSKIPAIRNRPFIYTSASFVGPTICLIAGLIATSYFYGVNASSTTYTLHSWSCQWSGIAMDVKPHWNVLCRETTAALYLMVMMIPLEVLVLASVAYSTFAVKKQTFERERKGSPAMS